MTSKKYHTLIKALLVPYFPSNLADAESKKKLKEKELRNEESYKNAVELYQEMIEIYNIAPQLGTMKRFLNVCSFAHNNNETYL